MLVRTCIVSRLLSQHSCRSQHTGFECSAVCRTIANPKPALSEGGKAGVTLAALAVVAAVIAGAVVYIKRRRRASAIAKAPEMHANLVHQA